MDRVTICELRARQLALARERPHRRRTLFRDAGLSSDFTNSRFDSYLVIGDWRHYFRLGKESAWALRAYGFYSGGDRPRRMNIGGTVGLRGYPQYGYILGSQAYMFNQELRFPILTHLTLGLPFGDSDCRRFRAASSPSRQGAPTHDSRPWAVGQLRH